MPFIKEAKMSKKLQEQILEEIAKKSLKELELPSFISDNLSQSLEEIGKKVLKELEIPSFISDNLSQSLREYQKEALKFYLANNDSFKKNHLLFNMATGSGKTLVMAALILECYKRGYENFVFFVSSSAILEKTKANFLDTLSSKYLFKEPIMMSEKQVQINCIEGFAQSKKGAINIYFNTIQGLFSLFKNEKENALCFEDFKDQKVVFLADEAHHLNAETKNRLSKSEKEEEKKCWESVTRNAFKAHKENLLFEFSATLPKESTVQEKYKDKIIYEYALKEFYKDKFSKKITLLQYNSSEPKQRFLGSVITSLYRELLAREYGLFLKPVVLYKSWPKLKSKQNEEEFKKLLHTLKAKDIDEFRSGFKKGENSILKEAFSFFKAYGYKDEALCELIKASFDEKFILNVNEEKADEKYQIKLNSLEDKDNEIRAIFAVDKLNEGWDVLNLFDIVRLNLNSGTIKESTQEAQLIGRGARYYPFVLSKKEGLEDLQGADLNDKYKRKFDHINTPLRALETLSYHAIDDNKFISRLEKELENEGIYEINEQKITLKIKEEIKDKPFYKEVLFATNSRYKIGGLFAGTIFNEKRRKKLKNKCEALKIPLFEAKGVSEKELLKDESENLNEGKKASEIHTHKDYELSKIEEIFFLKAMNKISEFYILRI